MPATLGGFALLVAACAALLAADHSARAADHLAHAETGDFAGPVDIGGGRKMYFECRGAGSPTVVLVAGLKASAEDWSIAQKAAPPVFPEIAKFTRVCAYDRPSCRSASSRAAAIP